MLGIYEKAINNKFDFATKIRMAKEAGYDFMEFSVDESEERLKRLDWSDESINEVVAVLKKADFYLNSMAFSGLRKFPYGSHDPAVRQKALLLTEKAITLAKKLGIRTIQLAGYDVFYEKGDPQTRKWFLENVAKAVKIAERHSVMLSFEVMDTPFMGTTKKALRVIKKISSPYLQIYPDLGNLSQHAEDVCEDIKAGKGHLVGVHFKDTLPGKFRDVPFGAGTVDFAKCMGCLSEIEYRGPFLIETWSKNKAEETYAQNLEFIKEAKGFFDKFSYQTE